jgi:pectin methylesterase-like acyl-CoA thioesterase
MAELQVGASKTYTDVQSAINAANTGDTIKIFAGTYTGNVSVTKNGLTITNATGEAVQLIGTGGYSGVISIAANVTGTTLTSDTPANFSLSAASTQQGGLYLVQNNDFTSVFNMKISSGMNSGNAVFTGGGIM